MVNRVVIFAAFNKFSKIEDYVLYYLQSLQLIAHKIIYIADNEPSAPQLEQLRGLADYVLFENHGEYDFGSYKRGIKLAEEKGLLDDADELVLCNDSCYGAVFPFTEMFEQMEASSADFWGVTQNCENPIKHIQSYFMVFKKPVFCSQVFKTFFESIKKQKHFWDVVTKYEVGLTRTLADKGDFCFDSYIKTTFVKNKFRLFNPTTLPISLYCAGAPLLKRKVFTQGGYSSESLIMLIWIMQNLTIKQHIKQDFFTYFLKRNVDNIKRFFYQNKITKSGHRIIKICKIPVLIISTEISFDGEG